MTETLLNLAAQAFIAGLWQGALLLAAVATALRLVPRLSPTARFAVWSAAFLTIAALPLVHVSSANSAPITATVHLSVVWAIIIAASWALLLIVRLTRLARHSVNLRQIWNSATPLTPSAGVQAILKSTTRQAELCSSNHVDAPSVIGFLAPRILIPADLLPTLSEDELHQIVRHECEHLRRRDDWINLIQKLALALFPLNPALLIADSRLGLERELACDAAVIRTASSPLPYAKALARLAEHSVLRRPLTLALSAWNRQSELTQRIYRLLSPTRRMSPLGVRASLALLGIALTGGSLELARSPYLVSFTEDMANPIAASTPFTIPTLRVQGSVQDRVQDRLQDPVQAVPVLFHPTQSPRPTIIRTRHKLRPTTPTLRETVAPIAIQDQPRLALIRALQQTPRPVQAIWTDFSPTYAAIPVADGWLIIQI